MGPRPYANPLRIAPHDDTVIAAFGRAGWDRTFVLEAGARYAELATRSVAEMAAMTGGEPSDVSSRSCATLRRPATSTGQWPLP